MQSVLVMPNHFSQIYEGQRANLAFFPRSFALEKSVIFEGSSVRRHEGRKGRYAAQIGARPRLRARANETGRGMEHEPFHLRHRRLVVPARCIRVRP